MSHSDSEMRGVEVDFMSPRYYKRSIAVYYKCSMMKCFPAEGRFELRLEWRHMACSGTRSLFTAANSAY